MPLSKSAKIHPALGRNGQPWGINRTVAQVHALLFLSRPAHRRRIAETLAVARSNVSTSLRELQNWQLVQPPPAR